MVAFVRTTPFRPQDDQYEASRTIGLPVPSADTTVLVRAAMAALNRLWREGYRYKKAGITLLELVPAAQVQGDLWSVPDTTRRKALMQAMYKLNATWGLYTLTLAGSGVARGWRLRSEQRSQSYTTSRDELLCVE